VAPRFISDETADPIAAIAREARTTFGADYGVLWRIRKDDLELLAVDPPRPNSAIGPWASTTSLGCGPRSMI
jgi:hypothetical protein